MSDQPGPGQSAAQPWATRLQAEAQALRKAGAALRAMSVQQRADGLSTAALRLLAPDPALREALLQTTGLSAPMIAWGLNTTLSTFDRQALLALTAEQEGSPWHLLGCVLSGNLFTACMRALALPLLAGVPVLAKASNTDAVLPLAFAKALAAHEPRLGHALRIVRFGREQAQASQALCTEVDALSVYGSDATIEAFSALWSALDKPGPLLPHGHGLGAVYVPAETLSEPDHVQDVARRVALDVAAYDQRGCLSPHFVLVEEGAAVGAERFAVALHSALDEQARALPRGPLSDAALAACMQWRGVAAARGTCLEGDAHAVSYEGAQGLRPSPGYRHVGVYRCADRRELATRLEPLGHHLKALGVAASHSEREALAQTLPPALRPRISRVGAMQTPPVHARADGLPAMHGLLRRPGQGSPPG